jgi:hypothetical protein
MTTPALVQLEHLVANLRAYHAAPTRPKANKLQMQLEAWETLSEDLIREFKAVIPASSPDRWEPFRKAYMHHINQIESGKGKDFLHPACYEVLFPAVGSVGEFKLTQEDFDELTCDPIFNEMFDEYGQAPLDCIGLSEGVVVKPKTFEKVLLAQPGLIKRIIHCFHAMHFSEIGLQIQQSVLAFIQKKNLPIDFNSVKVN